MTSLAKPELLQRYRKNAILDVSVIRKRDPGAHEIYIPAAAALSKFAHLCAKTRTDTRLKDKKGVGRT